MPPLRNNQCIYEWYFNEKRLDHWTSYLLYKRIIIDKPRCVDQVFKASPTLHKNTSWKSPNKYDLILNLRQIKLIWWIHSWKYPTTTMMKILQLYIYASKPNVFTNLVNCARRVTVYFILQSSVSIWTHILLYRTVCPNFSVPLHWFYRASLACVIRSAIFKLLSLSLTFVTF